MKALVLKIIRLYQATLSPDTGWLKDKHPHGFCRFYPHCSQYGYEAIEKFGLFKGGLKTVKRILKCNPFHPGGVDKI
ncbi:MAG: membrane protein insertion efficiency factor YidD [Patescibacteria group bacterium]|jgi:hypothetical protein